MPILDKLLSKFSRGEREILCLLIDKIISMDWRGLDIKKLKGYADFFRLRKGNLRVIYQVRKNKTIYILAIERRTSKTYK